MKRQGGSESEIVHHLDPGIPRGRPPERELEVGGKPAGGEEHGLIRPDKCAAFVILERGDEDARLGGHTVLREREGNAGRASGNRDFPDLPNASIRLIDQGKLKGQIAVRGLLQGKGPGKGRLAAQKSGRDLQFRLAQGRRAGEREHAAAFVGDDDVAVICAVGIRGEADDPVFFRFAFG